MDNISYSPKLSLTSKLKQQTLLRTMTLLIGGAGLLFSLIYGTTINESEIEINLLSGPHFMGDKNGKCTQKPNAGFISFEVCNTSPDPQENIYARLSDFTNSNFGLAGNQPADQFLGTLKPGECRTVYWYTFFDCGLVNSTSDMTVKVYDIASPDTVSQTISVEAVKSLKAAAGGNIYDTKVAGANVLGALLEYEVEYTYGFLNSGTSLVFQPAGNLDFDAECFQLVGSEVISSEMSEIPVGDQGKLYYDIVNRYNGTDHRVRVKYYFQNNCEGISTNAYTYAASVSGQNYKHSANIGDPQFDFFFPSAESKVIVNNYASTNLASAGDLITYKIDVINKSTEWVTVEKIENQLPDGFIFETVTSESEVNGANTEIIPDGGEVQWVTFLAGTPSDSYPYRNMLLAPQDTLTLVYDAKVADGIYEGDYSNTAYAVTGSGQTAEGTSILCVGTYPCILPVSWHTLEANQEGPSGLINWEISDGGTGDHFEVERSIDGNLFETVGTVAAQQTNERKAYTYRDTEAGSLNTEKLFYRVKHTDVNGMSLYSEILTLNMKESTLAVQIYPNPVAEYATIQLQSSSTENLSLRVYTATGRDRIISTVPGGGVFEQKLYIADWPTGVYYLEIRGKDEKIVKPFMKK